MASPAPSQKPLWSKLGVKPGDRLHVVDAPAEVDRSALAAAHGTGDGLPAEPLAPGDVVLAFAPSRAALAAMAARLRPLLGGDVRVWVAYPKGGKADYNRDTGWEPMRALGLEPVSQVAIDATWSALRLRHRDHTTRRAGGR